MEIRTIVCYLGAVGANLRAFSFGGSVEPFPWSAQPWLIFLYREKTGNIKTHKTAINRPVDHTGET